MINAAFRENPSARRWLKLAPVTLASALVLLVAGARQEQDPRSVDVAALRVVQGDTPRITMRSTREDGTILSIDERPRHSRNELDRPSRRRKGSNHERP